MPRSAPSACTEPGCPALVHDGKSKCPEHRQEQRRTNSYAYKARPENKKYVEFYASTAWKRLSVNHRKRYPLCNHCLQIGITKPADVCDHIKEIRDQYELRLDVSNLESLCHTCHNAKTAKVRKARNRAS